MEESSLYDRRSYIFMIAHLHKRATRTPTICIELRGWLSIAITAVQHLGPLKKQKMSSSTQYNEVTCYNLRKYVCSAHSHCCPYCRENLHRCTIQMGKPTLLLRVSSSIMMSCSSSPELLMKAMSPNRRLLGYSP